MKVIWKSYLKLSLVTIPIKMFNAIAGKFPHFYLYHLGCGSQIRQEVLCPVYPRRLSRGEVLRRFPNGKDRW